MMVTQATEPWMDLCVSVLRSRNGRFLQVRRHFTLCSSGRDQSGEAREPYAITQHLKNRICSPLWGIQRTSEMVPWDVQRCTTNSRHAARRDGLVPGRREKSSPREGVRIVIAG